MHILLKVSKSTKVPDHLNLIIYSTPTWFLHCILSFPICFSYIPFSKWIHWKLPTTWISHLNTLMVYYVSFLLLLLLLSEPLKNEHKIIVRFLHLYFDNTILVETFKLFTRQAINFHWIIYEWMTAILTYLI